jgi:hypothetical protein
LAEHLDLMQRRRAAFQKWWNSDEGAEARRMTAALHRTVPQEAWEHLAWAAYKAGAQG